MKKENPPFGLRDYRNAIQLDQVYEGEEFQQLSSIEREKIITNVVKGLASETTMSLNADNKKSEQEKRQLIRALLNVRAPKPLAVDLLRSLNRLLQAESYEKGRIKASTLKPISETIACAHKKYGEQFVLWQGDITQLEIDVIVNAANEQMLGCFGPLHDCIDNAIHSGAGPQLREDCQIIMKLQGELEKTGQAKLTRAYNLPSKFVLHTVGPIVPKGTVVTSKQKAELASCYISCLALANQMESIKRIAFCAISTGVFGFPKREAAEIAVHTVEEWLGKNPNHFAQILYCVFSEEDYHEYARAFQEK